MVITAAYAVNTEADSGQDYEFDVPSPKLQGEVVGPKDTEN